MKSIALPAGTMHVRFGDLPELIAGALHPDAGTDLSAIKYVAARNEVLRALRRAVEAGSLQVFSPLNPMVPHEFPFGDALNRALVTVADLRQFVAPAGVRVDAPEAAAEPEAAPVEVGSESKVKRQDRRLKACLDAGLPMNEKAALSRLPDGVGDVADREGVTRQSFSTDVKAALKRRESAKREGQIVRRP